MTTTNPATVREQNAQERYMTSTQTTMDTLRPLVNWSRKAEAWAAATVINPDVLQHVAALPTFDAEAEPCMDFDKAGLRPQFFVANLPDGRRFLVDTQGYNYARYIAALPSTPTFRIDASQTAEFDSKHAYYIDGAKLFERMRAGGYDELRAEQHPDGSVTVTFGWRN